MRALLLGIAAFGIVTAGSAVGTEPLYQFYGEDLEGNFVSFTITESELEAGVIDHGAGTSQTFTCVAAPTCNNGGPHVRGGSILHGFLGGVPGLASSALTSPDSVPPTTTTGPARAFACSSVGCAPGVGVFPGLGKIFEQTCVGAPSVICLLVHN